MARARNIKPAFFKNELLGTADPLVTILFVSLWCLADREGRLEDRPMRIKAETFPYREKLDVNGYLTELERMHFIRRYSINGQALIQVLNFTKHQTPHKTEKPSELPAFDPNSLIEQDNGSATVNQPLESRETTAPLPPDSLIPDSLIPDSTVEAQPQKQKRDASATRLPADWMPSEIDAAFCQKERPDLSVEITAARFRDYWIAQPGAKARKADWPATWRNWVRNERRVQPREGPHGKPPKFDPTAHVNRNRKSS